MHTRKTTKTKMEQLQDSLQWWKNFQIIWVPVIAVLTGALLYYYSQRKIVGFDKKIRQEEQAEIHEREEKERIEKLSNKRKEAIVGKFVPEEIKSSPSKTTPIKLPPLVVSIGSNTSILTNRGSGYVFKPLNSFANSDFELTIKFDSNRMLISATFRNLEGNIVSRMIDNEWKVNPGKYFDRNYDDKALEVIDIDGITKFHIDLLSPNKVLIGGLIVDSKLVMEITPTYFTPYGFPKPEEMEKAKKYLSKVSDNIPNLFRYPSDLHFGERTPKATMTEKKKGENPPDLVLIKKELLTIKDAFILFQYVYSDGKEVPEIPVFTTLDAALKAKEKFPLLSGVKIELVRKLYFSLTYKNNGKTEPTLVVSEYKYRIEQGDWLKPLQVKLTKDANEEYSRTFSIILNSLNEELPETIDFDVSLGYGDIYNEVHQKVNSFTWLRSTGKLVDSEPRQWR